MTQTCGRTHKGVPQRSYLVARSHVKEVRFHVRASSEKRIPTANGETPHLMANGDHHRWETRA